MKFVPLSVSQTAYCDQGRAELRRLLPGAEVHEGPELQALYDWCLEQGWNVTDDELEQYSPVLALAIGLGDCIAGQTCMEWGWATETGFGWEGPALQMPGTAVACFPMPMMLKRLQERARIRMEPLISGTAESIGTLLRQGPHRH